MRVDHIGIAVKDVEAATKRFQIICPDIPVQYEKSKDGSMLIAFLIFDNLKLELMQPLTKDSVVGKFLEKRGEGVHHLALEVEDILAGIDMAKNNGVRPVNDNPREGSRGSLITFLHPKDLHGVLVELCQVKPNIY